MCGVILIAAGNFQSLGNHSPSRAIVNRFTIISACMHKLDIRNVLNTSFVVVVVVVVVVVLLDPAPRMC